MFGADKKAHTDAFIKAVVAKVGPKKMKGDITKESQPWRRRSCGTDKLWDVEGKRESFPGRSCTTGLPLPLGTRC